MSRNANTTRTPEPDEQMPAEWIEKFSLSPNEHIDWARMRRDLVEAGVFTALKAKPEALIALTGVRTDPFFLVGGRVRS